VTTPSGAREGLSSVTRGTLFLFVATLCYIGLNFVARVILVRSISPADWDAFSFGLALLGVAAAAGSVGLPNAVARSLPFATTEPQRRSIVRGALAVGGGAAVASGVVLWLLGPWITTALHLPALGPTLIAFPIAVAATIGVNLIASVFQGYEDVTPNALFIQILPFGLFVAFLGGTLLLGSSGINYGAALGAYAVANVVSLALVIAYYLARIPRYLTPGAGAPGALGHLLVFAAPLLLVTLMTSIVGFGDTLVLGAFDPAGIGTYTNSLTLARLLLVGVTAASYIFLPVATRLHRQSDTTAVGVTYVTVTKWMILFSLPLFLLFVFLPARSLEFVYGSAYAVVVVPLQVATFGAFLVTALGPSANAQVAFGQTRLLALNSVVAAAVDIGLAFALVPIYGLTGAAVAWAVANTVYTALSLGELAWITGVHPFRPHFVVPLVATAVPVALFLEFAPVRYPFWSLPLVAVGIAVLLVLVILATRSVDEGDRLLLGALENLVGRPLPLLRRIGRLGLPRTNGGR